MDDSAKQKDINLFQQIGQIQGSLVALNANITDFKTEFRTMTNSQNDKIESLRKEIAAEVKALSDKHEMDNKELSSKIEILEQDKAKADGVKEEAKRTARWTGGITGGGVGIGGVALLEFLKYIANLIHH